LFPSILLGHFPGLSGAFKVDRDAKEEKKNFRRAEKVAAYRARRRAEKESLRASNSGLSSADIEATENESPKPRLRGRAPNAKPKSPTRVDESETDLGGYRVQ
jgi:hypothetical protein